MDFGLLGGWPAGGPATASLSSLPAPAGAQVPAVFAGPSAPDSAFLELMKGCAVTLIPLIEDAAPWSANPASELDRTAPAVLPPVFQFDVASDTFIGALPTPRIGLAAPLPDADAPADTESTGDEWAGPLVIAAPVIPQPAVIPEPLPPAEATSTPGRPDEDAGQITPPHQDVESLEIKSYQIARQDVPVRAARTIQSEVPDMPGPVVPPAQTPEPAATTDIGFVRLAEADHADGAPTEVPTQNKHNRQNAHALTAFVRAGESLHVQAPPAATANGESRRGDEQHPQAPAPKAVAKATVQPLVFAAAPVASFAVLTHRSTPLTMDVPARQELPRATTQQIVQSLRLVLTRGGGEARIKLDPQQFGDLTVMMRVDRGNVVASLQAESPTVREWIRTNQDALRAGLAEQQLRLDRLDVRAPEETNDEGPREDGQRREEESRSPRQRRRRPQDGEVFDIVA